MELKKKIINWLDGPEIMMFLLIVPFTLIAGWLVYDSYNYETSALIKEETSTLTNVEYEGGLVVLTILYFDNGRVLKTSDRHTSFVIGEEYNLKVYESGKIDYERI